MKPNTETFGPKIDSLPSGHHRPTWSVMIPTFNCADLLQHTLKSVLQQDLGPNQMQIEVIDDHSTKDDPEKIVNELGHGRVKFFRQPTNQGLCKNFNTCIRRSRGELVHILHGDDLVEPGFYNRVSEAAKIHGESCSLYATRSRMINNYGEQIAVSKNISELNSPSNVVGDLFFENNLYTPAIVVRRTAYEKFGGFNEMLSHTADWEMWVRIIALGNGILIDEVLTTYRFTPVNDTSRLIRTGANLTECLITADCFAKLSNEFQRNRFQGALVQRTKNQIRNLIRNRDAEAFLNNIKVLISNDELVSVIKFLLRLSLREKYFVARSLAKNCLGWQSKIDLKS